MILTEENYYSQEANMKYMSVSQFKDFMKCEAYAMAKLTGEHTENKKDCFLVGSYVGAAIEGDEVLKRFIEKNPDIISSSGKTKGNLKSEFIKANKMIDTLESDPVCRSMLEGQKEVIATAELFGVMWKIKIDVYNPEEGRLIDLKTVKGIHEKYWNGDKYVSFVEYFGYVLQMAVYTKVEQLSSKRNVMLEPFIVAVSKEDEPDKAVICFDDDSLSNELLIVEALLPRFIAVKEEIEKPNRCEKCDYCRKTKQIERLIHFSELIS